MAIIYPDIEKTLVAHLKSQLGTGVRVATKKPAADATQPAKLVVVSVAYAGDKEPVTRFAGVVVDVYADTYAQASTLAFQTEAALRTATGDSIKKVTIITGPIRLGDETEQEKRSISAEVVVKATDI